MTVNDVVGTESWPQFEATLTGHLSGLHRHGFVTIDPPRSPSPGPSPETAPRRGLLGRLSRRRTTVRDRPLVQLSRDDRYLEAECSGPVGDVPADTNYPWDDDQQHRLLELGWQPPDALDDWHLYRWHRPLAAHPAADAASAVPTATVQEAGRLVVATLRDVYGLGSPAGSTLVVDRYPG